MIDETHTVSHVAPSPPMNTDKSITSFHLALKNVTYEIERTTN